MQTSKFYYDEKKNRVEIWKECLDSHTNYWMKVNGVSKLISKKQYDYRVKISLRLSGLKS